MRDFLFIMENCIRNHKNKCWNYTVANYSTPFDYCLIVGVFQSSMLLYDFHPMR